MLEVTTQSSQPAQVRVTQVPVVLLERNPYQVRIDPETAIQQLMESIVLLGLLNLITARQVGDRYQIISGHRRVEAFRRLWSSAQTEEERRRYETIPAQILPEVSDAQMALSVLVENLQRVDLDEVEVASGLAQYQQFEDLSASELAKKLGQDVTRVRRLLKLHGAPEFIKDFVRKGVRVTIQATPDENGEGGPSTPELRRLDLMGAVEFVRLHENLMDDYRNLTHPSAVREQVEPVIRKALEQGWSLRAIQKECRKLRRTLKKQSAAPDASNGENDELASEATFGAEAAGTGSPSEAGPAEEQDLESVLFANPHSVARAPGSERNPAWEWLNEAEGDLLLHLSQIQHLNRLQLKEVDHLLGELKMMVVAYLEAEETGEPTRA